MPDTRIAVVDTDGTILARMEPEVAERQAPGFVPATVEVDGRFERVLAPPVLVEAMQSARNALADHSEFWEAVRTMDEPEGIRSSLA